MTLIFASFELHNALRVSKATDASGRSYTPERVSQDNTIRVAFPATMTKGTTSTLTFDYERRTGHGGRQPGGRAEAGLYR